VPFDVIVSGIDETERPGESAAALVERLAREKCLDVAGRLGDPLARPVLGADTIVVAGGLEADAGPEQVLGKPRDPAHAVALLSLLVGTTHRVMTGVAVAWSDGRGRSEAGGPVWTIVETSRVTFRDASRMELEEYVAIGESMDKAGAYALQGGGARFVTGVVGDPTNVIGLPEAASLALLRSAGVPESSLGR
jgi:septum formation protein